MNPGNKILMLEPIETQQKKTEGGILYSTDEPTRKGRVLRIGHKVNENMKRGEMIKQGDVVNYFPQEANQFHWDKKPIVLVHVNAVSTID